MSTRLERLRERTNGYTVTPEQYLRVAYVALGALTLIVLTGAAVRLTGSGLGCPTWPKCYGNVYPPLNTHAVIEFSNRLITVPVSIAAGLAWLRRLRRRPYRRDLMWLGALLPLGVVAPGGARRLHRQGRARLRLGDGPLRAVDADPRRRDDPRLAGLPRAREQARTRRRAARGGPRRSHARAADARAGGARRADDLRRDRRDGRRPARGRLAGAEDQPAGLRRAGTMDFVIHRHAEIAFVFSLAAVGLWLLARRRAAGPAVQRPLTVLCVLLALQGVRGAGSVRDASARGARLGARRPRLR